MAESVNVINVDDLSGGAQMLKKKIEKTIAIAPKPQAVFPRPLLVIGLDQKFLTTDQKSQSLFKKKPNEAPVSQIIFPQAQLTGVKPTVFVGFENNFLHSAFAKELPIGYDYYKSKRKLRCGDNSLKMHIKVHSIDELMKWFSDYSAQSTTTWRVSKTYPKGDNRHSFKKEYHCQHKNVSRPDRPDPKKSPKNLHCPALLTIALLKEGLVQSKKNKDSLAAEGYLGYILFTHQHNHDMKSDVVLKHRDVSKETEEKLISLFQSGKNPRAALEDLRSDLYMNNSPAEFTKKCGDRSVCPDVNYCYRLYYKTMGKPVREPGKEPRRKRRKTGKVRVPELQQSDLDTLALHTLADLGTSAHENEQAMARGDNPSYSGALSDYTPNYLSNQNMSYNSNQPMNQSVTTLQQPLAYPNNQPQLQPTLQQPLGQPGNIQVMSTTPIAPAPVAVAPNPKPNPPPKQTPTPKSPPPAPESSASALVTKIHNFSRKLLTLSTQEKHEQSLTKFLDHFKDTSSDTKFLHTLTSLTVAPPVQAPPPCAPAAVIQITPPPPLPPQQPQQQQQQQMSAQVLHRTQQMPDHYNPNNYQYHSHSTYRQL